MTLDLFDAPVLPGLSTRGDLVDAGEEHALIERIDATDLTPFRFQGWTGKRLTTSFGWSYDFEVGRPAEAPPSPGGCCRSATGRRALQISIRRS
ncbi:hypothetical protein [Sphingomonas sp. 22R3R2A-7]|uniref:hypothetical protein n=1 Tax=Sphingomonas sp. 22R3R2A-7 TaxID=3050230 RepID=UPI002FE249B2